MARKARKLTAARRPTFCGTWECECAVCVEHQQLRVTAQFNPAMPLRQSAMTFLGAMDRINEGAYGGVAIEQLFD